MAQQPLAAGAQPIALPLAAQGQQAQLPPPIAGVGAAVPLAVQGQQAQLPPLIAGVGAAVPLATPIVHRSFASFYSDDTLDPLPARAAAVLGRFAPDAQVVQAGADLLTTTLENASIPHTFLCCTALHPKGQAKVYLLHAFSRYPQAPDGTVTPWDRRIFCYLGEINQGNIMTVAVPGSIFNLVNNTRVYDEATFANEFVQQPRTEYFPKLTAQAAGSTLLRTRYAMRLPTKYAPLLLSPKGYHPKDVYDLLIEAFTADNFLIEARPILNWLRVSMHATRADNTGPPATNLALVAPFLDEDLIMHRAHVLNMMLPNRAAPATGLEAALTQFANAVITQTNEVRTARLARDIERELPTTPTAKFGMLMESLKNLLAVQEEAELPDFWFQFSAAKKKQEFSILRECLESYARSEHAFVSIAPIATPKLHADVATVTFLADHHDDLKGGIQPFCVMDGSEEHQATGVELSRSFGLLYEREFGISFSDLEAFKCLKSYGPIH